MKEIDILKLLLELRDNTHLAHLQSTNMAEHKTLQGFYGGILELFDCFAEQYTGVSGKPVTNIGNITIKEGIKVDSYLKQSAKQFEEYRNSSAYPTLIIIIDDILSLIYKTIYLLKLK